MDRDLATPGRPALARLLGAFVLLAAASCGAPGGSAATAEDAPGRVRRLSDAKAAVIGVGRRDAQEALSDAIARAEAFGREQRLRVTPLRAEPGEGVNPLGQPVYTCRLTFGLAPLPPTAAVEAADHTRSAFERRMRNLVEAQVITIEEYAQLMANHPGAEPAHAPPR